MSRTCTQRLHALVTEAVAERRCLSVSELEVDTGHDVLGQPAIFVWVEVPRDCETGMLRRERLALTQSLQRQLRKGRDHRHPFVYLLTAGEWPQRHALLPKRSDESTYRSGWAPAGLLDRNGSPGATDLGRLAIG